MALKFWLGGARSDKSIKMLEYVLKEAEANRQRQYLYVVPEQYTLSTQRELVIRSANHGIMNVDVLSFMRLSHRIGDEVGSVNATVTTLDDMGKNLLLQLLAGRNKDSLPVFGDNIDKLGYITKVKSIVSEFMQYGISPDKVLAMSENAKNHGHNMLSSKLSDVHFLYQEFMSYIHDKYTTTEETLAGVASIVYKSETIRNSVIIFDGFTGFTPVQMRLIATLLEYARDIHVALLFEEDKKELFTLSKQTIDTLERLADERRVVIADYYIAEKNSEADSQKTSCQVSDLPNQFQEISHHLFAGLNPMEEVRMATHRIGQLLKEGYQYKDIAVITGDIEGYRDVVERIFTKADIPYFIDKTQPMLLNPFIEYIRAFMQIYTDNYSYEAMMRYLKSGITSYDRDVIDDLDNYCLAAGIKGYKAWHSRFIKTTKAIDEDKLLELEKVRESIVSELDSFKVKELKTVRDFACGLYEQIIKDSIEDKLKTYAEMFEGGQNPLKAREFGQVYPKVMDLLDELVELIGDEETDIRKFAQLMDAGLDAIRIGLVPKGSDYIQVGDLTRSRLNDIKALFILGANDGIIPQNKANSGIINEADRQFLLDNDSELVLAPTAREDAFTQRLYLYMAMNKPSEHLYISYSKLNLSGKSIMPSYLIRKEIKEHPGIRVETMPSELSDRLTNREDILTELAVLLGKITSQSATEAEKLAAKHIIHAIKMTDEIKSGTENDSKANIEKNEITEDTAMVETDNACEREKIPHVIEFENTSYKKRAHNMVIQSMLKGMSGGTGSVSRAVARAIYGQRISGSVSRLETYANCAYQYFLRYGLKLEDREEFTFEASELGSIFHEALLEYSRLIDKEGGSWFDIDKEHSSQLMNTAVETVVARLHMAALYSTARSTYMVKRIKRIMQRTAEVVSSQVKAGDFAPEYFELEFKEMGNLDSLNIQLNDQELMRLYGKIDRIDTCTKENGCYVKIIDYKSGNKKMDLAAVYEGRQLQLLVYLNVAMEHIERSHGKDNSNIIPAGILYYHIDDPIVGDDGQMSDEEIKQSIMEKLRLTGLINEDNNGLAANMMDKELANDGAASSVVKVKRKKDGDLGKSAELVSGSDFDVMLEYVDKKIAKIGNEIIDGNISIPHPDGDSRLTEPDCEYCEYKTMCIRKGLKEDSDSEQNESADDKQTDDIQEVTAKVKLSKDDYIAKMKEKFNK